MKTLAPFFGYITEGFGHGILALIAATCENLELVAFSKKDNQEDFEKEVNQIYNNLAPFFPDLIKADWEDRDYILLMGRDIRADILEGQITPDMWEKFATVKLTAANQDNLPEFQGIRGKNNLLFIPQKLYSDGLCGVSAENQSIAPKTFNFLKEKPQQLVLGQHFSKVNDLETVQNLADEFNLYVPGMTEDEEVFGIRGVQHIKYWNFYRQMNGSIGIAGTHTWLMLVCFPEIPQIILYNKNGVEDWESISKAYRKAGYSIYSMGFDNETDMQQFSKELEYLANWMF